MNIERLREFCLSLPGTTEDIKWEDHLCFSVGDKMFVVSSMREGFTASFKVTPEQAEELTATPGIIPTPYMARYHWVLVQEPERLTDLEWENYVRQSYEMIKSKLPKKLQKELDSL